MHKDSKIAGEDWYDFWMINFEVDSCPAHIHCLFQLRSSRVPAKRFVEDNSKKLRIFFYFLQQPFLQNRLSSCSCAKRVQGLKWIEYGWSDSFYFGGDWMHCYFIDVYWYEINCGIIYCRARDGWRKGNPFLLHDYIVIGLNFFGFQW